MKNIFSLKVDNIFIFSFYLICIFGILFFNWDIFLILYIFWAEFLILSILKIIIFIFNIISSFSKNFKFIDLFFVFLEIILKFIIIFFPVLFYGFIMFILFRLEDVSNYYDNYGKNILIFFADYMINYMYTVWLPILVFILNNLYMFFSDVKNFLKNLEKEYSFKIFVNHFFLLFTGIILQVISNLFDSVFLARKISVVFFVLLLFLFDINKNNIRKNQN